MKKKRKISKKLKKNALKSNYIKMNKKKNEQKLIKEN